MDPSLGDSTAVAIAAAAAAAGLGAGFIATRWWQERLKAKQLTDQQGILDQASREAETIVREAKLIANEEVLKLREQTEQAFAKRRQEQSETEKRLAERERLLNHQFERLIAQEGTVREQGAQVQAEAVGIAQQRAELKRLIADRREELSRVANLSTAEARRLFVAELEKECVSEAAQLSRHILEEARHRADDEAKRIISIAINRYAGDHTCETTTSTITLPSEEIKGRIIGREGRNIRAFEALTGVTVLIDDTPNAVVLSGFDPVRREIAREAMQRLIQDGRIHPTRIEEVVGRVSTEMDETILRTGEEALLRLALPPMHAEIMRLLGRLKYRRSFTQNILEHSIEVANLMALLAAELGLDLVIAKKVGLLHDLGKAVDHQLEGAHALVGAEILKRYGELPEVVNGVASHHNEVPPEGPWGILAGAADAISASRPGARSETMATYLKRLENLERIGLSFPGVDKCFAVQAGRELRVLVQPENISDDEAYNLARNIVRKIEDELQYPGQIRITVIRETRCVEYAK